MITLNDQDRLKSILDTIEKVKEGAVNWEEYREQTAVANASYNLNYLANKLQLIRTKALASELMEQHKMARVPGSRFVAGYEELKQSEVLYPDYELTVGALIADLSNTIELFLKEERTVRDWTINTSKPRYQAVRKITDDERDGLMTLIDFKMTIIEERLGIVLETNGEPDNPLDIKYAACSYHHTPEEFDKLIGSDIRWARDFVLAKYTSGEIDKDQFIAELRECEVNFAAKKRETPG